MDLRLEGSEIWVFLFGKQEILPEGQDLRPEGLETLKFQAGNPARRDGNGDIQSWVGLKRVDFEARRRF